MVGTATVADGAQPTVPVRVQQPLALTMEVDARNSLKTVVKIDPDLTAPITAGQRVGTATVTAPRFPGATVPVYAAADVNRASIFQRLMSMIRK